jgi:hypothetical protein
VQTGRLGAVDGQFHVHGQRRGSANRFDGHGPLRYMRPKSCAMAIGVNAMIKWAKAQYFDSRIGQDFCLGSCSQLVGNDKHKDRIDNSKVLGPREHQAGGWGKTVTCRGCLPMGRFGRNLG